MFSVGNKKKTPSDKMVTIMTSPIVVFNVMELFLTVKFQLDLFLYLNSDTRNLLQI